MSDRLIVYGNCIKDEKMKEQIFNSLFSMNIALFLPKI